MSFFFFFFFFLQNRCLPGASASGQVQLVLPRGRPVLQVVAVQVALQRVQVALAALPAAGGVAAAVVVGGPGDGGGCGQLAGRLRGRRSGRHLIQYTVNKLIKNVYVVT